MLSRKALVISMTLALTLCMSIGILAQAPIKKISEISNNGSNVSWRVLVPHKSVTLRVSTPTGEVFSKEFPAGTVPMFSTVTDRGALYKDGSFTYEIIVTPVLSPGVEDQLRAAREAGNGQKVALELRKQGLLPGPVSTTGAFRLLRGGIYTENDPGTDTVDSSTTKVSEEEQKRAKRTQQGTDIPTSDAQTFVTDLIVQGSTCIGIDCSTGESFGFDTLRLKENNLRFHFDDTSVSASFPSTDWRLAANDTSNGGRNIFMIQDATANRTPFSIEGNAPNNALYLDDLGNLGLGTSTPVVELQITDGDSPTLRLEQNGSSGFGSQSWDVAGNETNFFIRDVTNGSKLPFKIVPNAPTNSVYVNPTGVGIQTTSISHPFQVGAGLFQVQTNGNVNVQSQLSVGTGGVRFADGTIQTTAGGGGSGGGGATLGSSSSQHIFGGQGIITSLSSIAATIDYNDFSVSTGGAAGFLGSTIPIPYNQNLSNTSGGFIVYTFRYQDTDGTGTASQVLLNLTRVTITGGRASTTLFNSNTRTNTTENVFTVCQAAGGDFNASTTGMNLDVVLNGTATQTATFYQMQIYRVASCP